MMELLNKEIEKICKKNRLMGANVALFNNERIVYSYNYGYVNKAQNMKSKNDSLYMIGSNTKVMTAVCILKLMEEGLLSLEDDIKKFIPEFEVKSTFDYDKITIGNLLMHRSGLLGDMYHLIADKKGDFHDVISELKDTYLVAKPGTMFAYSNVGYTVLGIIIERVSGLTYQEYIDKTIAKPLGIGIHFLQTKEEMKPFSNKISLCYNRKGKEAEEPLGTMLPAGSNTYMTISDFVKFGQIFLKKDGTVLKKETLELMETLECPEKIDNEFCNGGYGLLHNMYNFGEGVGKVWGHGGDTMYHHSVFYYIPEQNIGVMVFTNNEQGHYVAEEMANEVVFSYLKEKGIALKEYSYSYNYIQADCDKYVGKYMLPIGVCEVRKGNRGELVTKIKGLSVNLKLCEDGFFKLCSNNLLLQFPPIKKELGKLRIKFADYMGKEVVIVEERKKNNKLQMPFGCRYEETEIPDSFRTACGRYKLANENLKEIKGSCLLSIKGDALILKMNLLGIKGSAYLKSAADNLAFVQGYGRGTGNDVTLREENDALYLTWCGLKFRKV